ncbi:Galactose oxidase, central domain [Amycolatopsis xylanica]|uniref:Galactose oxidase, central domain n=1 Tax=Amycolatopsis xylanica TaxID=589385 RepID=A0A1H3RF42_9PSEU|nr:DUF6603 domain-containing protein [Amycolatopsis xylanica]SDZ23945.1 Galactose oxidase, central domain [Amycolatopsis xylanica]
MAGGTLELVAREIAKAVQPLEQHLSTAKRDEFLLGLGFAVPGGIGPAAAALTTAAAQAAGLGPIIADLTGAIESENVARIVELGVSLLGALKGTFEAVGKVGPALQQAVDGSGGLTDAQRARLRGEAGALPQRLLDYVLITYVEGKSREAARLLGMLGIIDTVGGGFDLADPTVLPVPRRTVRFDRLLALLTNPGGMLDEVFDFGKSTFDGAKLLRRVGAYLLDRDQPFLYLTPPDRPESLDAFLVLLEVDKGTSPPSVAARFTVPAAADFSRTVELGKTWKLTLASKTRFAAGLGAKLSPPLHLTFEPNGALHIDASAELAAERTDKKPMLLIGQADGSRVEVQRFSVKLGIEADGAAGAEPAAEIKVDGGRVLIDLSSGDGFISTITGGGKIDAKFDLDALWSPSGGLRFEGGGGLELAIPAHLDLGPVEVTMLYLNAGISQGKIPLEISGSFKAAIGPITASVDRVGVIVTTKLGDGGNLGPLDLDFAFKPPNGVGLELDAGIVSGGGYLYVDRERGEYAGALALEFAGFLELQAIGLISTRMPDGSDGFSMLIVITTEFGGGGLQLGYGFTLLAVGGLIGINRRMDLDALGHGVRTGSIESVMFPKDVVANAPRILSDLRQFFPPENGRFLIGPMAKIGWGTPTLVSISLGVVVEIPPGNVAILGVLKCVLPTEQLPLLVLQVQFIGALQVDRSRLWFYAQLFESRILTMTIDGGMGLLVAWGDNPDFVLTVGGFHPSFTPPELPFEIPPRLSIDILNSPGRLIRVSGYFAVTSNTVQFGALAELRLGFSDFGIEGHLGFDALFRFSPFAFVIDISAGISLKAFGVGLFGIDLRFQLEGPAPWRAHGRGSISLLFFEISADFDISWGEEHNTTLPPVRVLPLLETEISKVEGWQTRLPSGGTRTLVTLRQLPDSDKLVLHPLGTLFIQQRAIPLGVRIDRIGAQRPSDGKRFSVEPADSVLTKVSVTGDKFAMAQFQDFDDAAKLSRPAYEQQDAGIELTAGKKVIDSPRVVRRAARYEQIVIDKKARKTATTPALAAAVEAPPKKKLVSVSPAVFTQLLKGSSTARSPLSKVDTERRQPFPPEDTVRIEDQRFVIAYRRNNVQAFPPSVTGTALPSTATFRSLATAADAVAEWVTADPGLAGKLHPIPESDALGTPAVSGAWASTANPAPASVASPGLVRLNTGKVFLAGGVDDKPVKTTGLLDPVNLTWSAGPDLNTARGAHAATKLDDGRVLLTGGLGLDSAEIYDPIAGTCVTQQHPMGTARWEHTATVLPNRRVLVAGGSAGRETGGTRTLRSAEVFSVDSGLWTDAKPMSAARSGHQAVPLANGHVLVIGGAVDTGGARTPIAFCERYDPVADEWTPVASMHSPRAGHQATTLPDGRILVTGGDPTGLPEHGRIAAGSLASAEIYDPGHDVWTPVADMPGGRSRHAAVPVRSGEVLVLGGTTGPTFTAGYRQVLRFQPSTGTWTTTGALAAGRADLAAVALADGRVLAVGGRPAPSTTTGTAEVFTP